MADVSGFGGFSDASKAKRTRIICTLGPSSWSVDMLGVLLDEGMNVRRRAESSRGRGAAVRARARRDSRPRAVGAAAAKNPSQTQVARLNFSHGDHKAHAGTLERLKEALAKRPGVHCAAPAPRFFSSAARPRGLSASQPRRRFDSSPRTIRVAAAAPPRHASSETPRSVSQAR